MDAYIALIRKTAETDYSVNVPDLPGCTTAGKTLDEAYAFAHEAIALYLEDMREDGETPPAPSLLEAIMADPENRDAVAILVAAPPAKSRSVKVMITMDEILLGQVDAECAATGKTRSGYLADAVRAVIPVRFGSPLSIGLDGKPLASPHVPLDAEGRVDLRNYRQIAPGVWTSEREHDATIVIDTGPLAQRSQPRTRKKIQGPKSA